jgi:hypothetical protein
MDIFETNKLILFIAFVIPGFISIKFYDLVFPDGRGTMSDRLIDAIAYSSINYAILFYPIVMVESSGLRESGGFLYYIFYVFVFLLAPAIWVFAWKKMRLCKWVTAAVPHPTSKPWDFVFSQRHPYFIKIYLKNGSIIGGTYSEKSFASSAPSEEQIYLEETWKINENGGFDRRKNGTAGVIVMASEIAYIELIEYKNHEAKRNVEKQAT